MMELICSSHEATSRRVSQVQEICRRNEISVTVRQCKGIEDVKKLEVDVNKCYVLILDDELVDLLESCGKLVAKILRITSKPNKFIYFKLVTDEKMEMFAADECDWRNCVDSEEELIQVYIRKICKSPTEFDETTNTCQAMQSLRFDSADHLSNSSFLNETVVNQPTKITHARPEAVESIHTFSSVNDNLDEKQCQNDLKRPSLEKGVHKARSEQNLGFSVSLPENKRNNIEHKGERKSLPDNLQSVTTNNLYPQLSGITSYVEAGMSYSNEQPRGTSQSHCHLQSHSHLQSPNLNRPLHPWSLNGHSFDSSGPYALPCQSGRGYSCRCGSCQTLHQQSSSFPQFHTLQPKSIAGSSTGRPDTTNNMNFRPEILAMNRNYTPTYDPNIQTDGSDNRTFSCGHCGHSVIPKHEMSDVGPSSETYHSAAICSNCRKHLSSGKPDEHVEVSVPNEQIPVEPLLKIDYDNNLALNINREKREDKCYSSDSCKKLLNDHQKETTTDGNSQTESESMCFETGDSQYSEASVCMMDKLQRLNSFLATSDVSPVKEKLIPLLESTHKTKQRCMSKALQCMSVICETICPGEGDTLKDLMFKSVFSAHKPEKSSTLDETALILKDSYNSAETWTLRRQILSVLSRNYSFDEVREMIPDLTKYRFYAAKQHSDEVGCGLPVSREKLTRNKKQDRRSRVGTLHRFHRQLRCCKRSALKVYMTNL